MATLSGTACDDLGCNNARRQPVYPYSFSALLRMARRHIAHSLRLSHWRVEWTVVSGLHAGRRSCGENIWVEGHGRRDGPALGLGKCLWGWGGAGVSIRLLYLFQRLGLSLWLFFRCACVRKDLPTWHKRRYFYAFESSKIRHHTDCQCRAATSSPAQRRRLCRQAEPGGPPRIPQ